MYKRQVSYDDLLDRRNNILFNGELYGVNFKFVYGLVCSAKGLSSDGDLCSILHLLSPPTRCEKYTDKIFECLKSVAAEYMKTATLKAVQLNEDCKDINIGFDESWQKKPIEREWCCDTH